MLILLGVQILGLLGVAVYLTITTSAEEAIMCWFASAFLSFGLGINTLFLARRARDYITRVKVDQGLIELEFAQWGQVRRESIPTYAAQVKLGRASGRGPRRLWLRLSDGEGRRVVEQHKVSDWDDDKIGQLLVAIRRARGEELTSAERHLLEARSFWG